MKTAAINLPFKTKIIRRFKCSYYARAFLLPPVELMYIAGQIKNITAIRLIDSVAEKLTLNNLCKIIKENKYTHIITMLAVDFADSDIKMLNIIKRKFPDIKIIVTGYLPTIYPKEFIKLSCIDFIALNEPESSVFNLIKALKEKMSLKGVKGIAYKENDKIFINAGKRIKEAVRISSALRPEKYKNIYSELFCKKPFTAMDYSRGCAFKCGFCVQQYSGGQIYRPAEETIDEIEDIVLSGYRYIKFMDDNFTTNKEKVMELCGLIIEKNIKIDFSVLSRIDSLTEELIITMKKAGLKRIYCGVESFDSQELIKYGKRYSPALILENLKLLKKYNIETAVFIINTEKNLFQNLKWLKKINPEFIIIDNIKPYPATSLFNNERANIDFSLFPYKCEFKDKATFKKSEILYYFYFYFSIKKIKLYLKLFFLYPADISYLFFEFMKFIFFKKTGVRNEFF